MFLELDEDGSGSIEFNEFKRMLEAFHFFVSLATCRRLFNHFDCNGTGSISYQEFVCGIFPDIIDVDDLSLSGYSDTATEDRSSGADEDSDHSQDGDGLLSPVCKVVVLIGFFQNFLLRVWNEGAAPGWLLWEGGGVVY